ncbi:MAG: DUF3090 domain-containing protein [Phycicoccus sp.]|nr:DUF3090 domain-containing protein [Phycicoccus sp.]
MGVTEFDLPERFVAGSVGPPGQRTFFLQARTGARLVSVSMEKEQLAVLADRVKDLLTQVGMPDQAPTELIDNGTLEAPIEDEFRVTTLALSWDAARQLVVIEAHDQDPTEEGSDPSTVKVTLSPPAAAEFARRSRSLIAAGRPPCPLCGQPLDPTGHICPRANGYRR